MPGTDKPTVEVPTGPPPADLVVDDLVVGDGGQFDASWDRGDVFRFGLGAGQVIAGWDRGVQGMKVGGRRRLVIPPHLGYGDRGAPPVIPPGETLVFVVDLLTVG